MPSPGRGATVTNGNLTVTHSTSTWPPIRPRRIELSTLRAVGPARGEVFDWSDPACRPVADGSTAARSVFSEGPSITTKVHVSAGGARRGRRGDPSWMPMHRTAPQSSRRTARAGERGRDGRVPA